MSVVTITPPTALVPLELAKQHLRSEDEADNALIEAYIAAACGHIDGVNAYLGRAVGTQVLEWRGVCFPPFDNRYGVPRSLFLPYGPVASVVSVTYQPPTGERETWSGDQYVLVDDGLVYVQDGSWPAIREEANAVRVRYAAGDSDNVPPAIVAAVLLMVGDLFHNRETVALGVSAAAIPMSTTVENLLRPWRVLEI